MFRESILLLASLSLSLPPAVSAQDYEYDPTSTEYEPDYLSTYSIVVRDPETAELGIGVASRVLAVGRNGSSFRGGVGVIVHQMSSNPFYGRIGMEMLMAGLHPQEIMAQLVRSDEASERRQEDGEPERALQILVDVRDQIPGKDNVWIALGSMYLKMGRRDDALYAIRRAVEINPYNTRTGSGGLSRNTSFEALWSDPEWIRIMGG